MDDVIRFPCAACGKRLKAPPALVGRNVKCACGHSQAVPPPAPPVTEPTPAAANPSIPAASSARNPPSPRSRRGGLVLWGCVAAAVAGAAVIAALFLTSRSGRAGSVWVDVVDLKRPVGEGSASGAGGGKLWITAYDRDGNGVGALVNGPSEAVDRELKAVETDGAISYVAKVEAGWLVPGSSATRVVTREGRGIQAASWPFAPTAVQIVPSEETITLRAKRFKGGTGS